MILKTIYHSIFRSKNKKEYAEYKDLILPIKRTNENLSNNNDYINSGVSQVNYLIQNKLINHDTELLDFGSGQGRLLNTLKYCKVKFKSYVGVDTSSNSIEWCKKYLLYSDNISFVHLPAANARYNPNENSLKHLPFHQESFDLVFLNSVFSHMLSNDVKFYLEEFRKIIKKNGYVYLTAFIEKNVPNVEENPENYIDKSNGVLHRVRYEKKYFKSLVKGSGFEIVKFEHQLIERTKQSVVVLQLKR